jgi:hypothetical protein
LLDDIWASLAFHDPAALQALLGKQAPVAGIENDPTQQRQRAAGMDHRSVDDECGARRARRQDAGAAQKEFSQ